MSEKMTFEEWLNQNPATFKENDAADLLALHGVDMHSEINYLLKKIEYQQYLKDADL